MIARVPALLPGERMLVAVPLAITSPASSWAGIAATRTAAPAAAPTTARIKSTSIHCDATGPRTTRASTARMASATTTIQMATTKTVVGAGKSCGLDERPPMKTYQNRVGNLGDSALNAIATIPMTAIQHQPTSFALVANAGSSVGRASLVLRNGRSPAHPVRRIGIEHLHLPIPRRERHMRLGELPR